MHACCWYADQSHSCSQASASTCRADVAAQPACLAAAHPILVQNQVRLRSPQVRFGAGSCSFQGLGAHADGLQAAVLLEVHGGHVQAHGRPVGVDLLLFLPALAGHQVRHSPGLGVQLQSLGQRALPVLLIALPPQRQLQAGTWSAQPPTCQAPASSTGSHVLIQRVCQLLRRN